MKNIKKILTILVALFILAIAVNAQPGSTDGFEDEPEDVPLDGGILLLATLGAAYGYKKFKVR